VNDTADRWLAELPRPRFTRPGEADAIPTELLAVVNQARAIEAGRTGGTARARVLSRSGHWLTIHGFGMRERAGNANRIAIVIEPAKAAETAPIMLEAYQLGPREQQVSRLVARGLPTREIAAALHLSAHTVRDYLKQVFEKVGVSSRGELVAKVFAERATVDLGHAAVGPSSGLHASS
jgi:DNA-binding CsgD family transcriptional regulator